MKERTRPDLGSISHGTLKLDDLLPAFVFAVEEYGSTKEATEINQAFIEAGFGYSQCGVCFGPMDDDDDPWSEEMIEEAEWMVEQLYDVLNEIASEFIPYGYFGALEGDGSDIGFWLSWDAVQDAVHGGDIHEGDTWDGALPRASYRLEVNDHGNASLYDREDKPVWEVV